MVKQGDKIVYRGVVGKVYELIGEEVFIEFDDPRKGISIPIALIVPVTDVENPSIKWKVTSRAHLPDWL